MTLLKEQNDFRFNIEKSIMYQIPCIHVAFGACLVEKAGVVHDFRALHPSLAFPKR